MSGCLYRSGNNKDNPQEIFVAGRLRETLATTPVLPPTCLGQIGNQPEQHIKQMGN